VHRYDQILLGRAQQIGVAGHRFGVIQDCGVYHTGLVGEPEPAPKIVAKL
jgi:hypothetical protein